MSGAQQVVRLAAGQPRTLSYAHGIRKDLQLLEVDEDLLQELLADGLCLKGGPEEEAVLCSASRTFAVKRVETTNLVLLVKEEEEGASHGAAPAAPALGSQDPNVQPTPPGQLTGLATQLSKNAGAARCAPVAACAVAGAHLELVPAAPRLHQLDALLSGALYGGEGSPQERALWGGSEAQAGGDDAAEDHMEADGSGAGLTEGDLLAAVQCSAAELRAALRERRALCLDGRYCLVDPGYQGMLLELALLTAVEHGWPLGRLPGARLAAALQPHGYDPRVTLHCLATFGSRIDGDRGGGGGTKAEGDPMDAEGGQGEPAVCAVADAAAAAAAGAAAAAAEAGGGGGSGVFALDEAAVCLHFARSLLLAQSDWELAEFEAAWQRVVPEGMLPALEMLRGEALLHGGGTGPHGLPSPRRIKHFPLAALPADAPARFAALFAERARWEWEDLAPYIQSLRGPGQTAEALLLKYARATQQRPTDPVTYSMR